MIPIAKIPASFGRFASRRTATCQASDFQSTIQAAWQVGRRYIWRIAGRHFIGDNPPAGVGRYWLLDPRLGDVLECGPDVASEWDLTGTVLRKAG